MTSVLKKAVLASAIVASLTACNGDDGAPGLNGSNGVDGSDGQNGLTSLVVQTTLPAMSEACFNGGLKIQSGLDANADGNLDSDEVSETSFVCAGATINESVNFNRLASFPVCKQLEPSCNIDDETAAEIVAISQDNSTLIYTDSPNESVGFVDISAADMPMAAGTLSLTGEPTSVAVKGNFALVGVNTSADFVNVSGQLDVIDINTQAVIRSLDLGGQPDSVAVSPDGSYVAVVIENERDEDLGDGAPPQLPAGSLVIVNVSDDDPANWTSTNVELIDLADKFPTDPEPEYVDINTNNVAVVTLQENNHIVLVNLVDGTIINDFSAGTVDLDWVDATEEDPALISQTESLNDVPREPDGVAWINNEYFATADEGDLDGGSRGFTVFNTAGEVVWTSGNTLDHLAARLGHYPDGRSGNKGNEPENVEVGIYNDGRFLFVNSERSSLVFVYDVANPALPVLKQILPAGAAPEGGLAIPSINLLVVASEEDNRGDKIRSVLNIYQYGFGSAQYPTLLSADRANGTPIPWSAMSGLAADTSDANTLYAVEDSFFKSNRIFKIDVGQTPALIVDEITLSDANDVFAAFPTSGATEDAESFDDVDLAAMINADKSVNIDPEGISMASDGGFWVASEGAGTIGDDNRPIEKLNFIFKTDATGVIESVVTLPADVNAMQLRFGFEGITEYNGKAYVAFQRAWGQETNPRIGIYDLATQTWSFVFYPLDAVESQDGGWVGLSDITALGENKFLVLERDNKGGPDAAIKRLYTVDLTGVVDNATLDKTLVLDLIPSLAETGALTFEKTEGTAVTVDGEVYIINDNDGVDDNSGETQLINLGKILN
ncbi:esterase-like activity of phytase family protein [Agaribacter flavus]|uniref:Esterase-like activity of phytase family protein n=1 Tax=Agaribacter flavus TaxID=1902781 RepID=A0ABV7FNQ5_9ALTE